jgi:rhamnose utilization protein RhaD (predicted bifunctional aldolase and dehydrogenase)
MPDTILSQLVELSQYLGRPESDCVILGEGNASARQDDQTFWVKASGSQMRTITADGFVRVAFDQLSALLDDTELDDQALKTALAGAKVDANAAGHPSMETLLHALFLGLDGVNFVGHTHPTAGNALTCSQAFPAAFDGRLFPDEIVTCGIAPLLVPYADPGLPLARRTRSLLHDYLEQYGEQPRLAWMQNHGLIALGQTPQQVKDITEMAIKTARSLLGAYAAGGPRFLSPAEVERIHTRPDELYRRQQMGLANTRSG